MRKAVADPETSPAALERARAQVDPGAMLRRREARETLRGARVL